MENLIASFRNVPQDTSRSFRRQTHSVGETVDKLLVKYQIGHSSPEDTIRSRWPELVSPAIAAYSHPVRIERGRLLVLVSHAVVRDELFRNRAKVVEKIKELPGCEAVQDLHLRSG